MPPFFRGVCNLMRTCVKFEGFPRIVVHEVWVGHSSWPYQRLNRGPITPPKKGVFNPKWNPINFRPFVGANITPFTTSKGPSCSWNYWFSFQKFEKVWTSKPKRDRRTLTHRKLPRKRPTTKDLRKNTPAILRDCWWLKSCYPVEVGSLSPLFTTGFRTIRVVNSRWISAINRISESRTKDSNRGWRCFTVLPLKSLGV